MVFQTLFNVLTGIVLMVLFYAETIGGIPLVHAFVTSLGTPVTQQMAIVYLIFNVFGAAMMFAIRGPLLGWIERRWPPSPEEDLGRLKFLLDQAMDQPDLALELGEKDQVRFLNLMQGNLDAARLPPGESRAAASTHQRAMERLHESLEEALTELSHKVGVDGSEQMISLANRNQVLGSLQLCLADFTGAVRATRQSASLESLSVIFLESLDALIGATIESVNSLERSELERMREATHSRSDQMRAIRKRMLNGEVNLTDNERLDLVNLTNCLERTVWMLHEYLCELMEFQSETLDD
jgi:phosphate:Na+ symporter